MALLLGFLREWFLQSRIVQNDSFLRSLSLGVELYREEFGRYPSSLEEMSLNRHMDDQWRELMLATVHAAQSNAWQDAYSYTSSTTGFVLSVTGPAMPPAGWFGRQRKVEKSYRIGEALNAQEPGQ